MDFAKYVEAALAIHAAASVITALTPTPKDDAFLVNLPADVNADIRLFIFFHSIIPPHTWFSFSHSKMNKTF
jgi:hypothetical protein